MQAEPTSYKISRIKYANEFDPQYDLTQDQGANTQISAVAVMALVHSRHSRRSRQHAARHS